MKHLEICNATGIKIATQNIKTLCLFNHCNEKCYAVYRCHFT